LIEVAGVAARTLGLRSNALLARGFVVAQGAPRRTSTNPSASMSSALAGESIGIGVHTRRCFVDSLSDAHVRNEKSGISCFLPALETEGHLSCNHGPKRVLLSVSP